MDMENLNIWCEKCKIPMVFSYREDSSYYYVCPGCGNKKRAKREDSRLKIYGV